MLSAIVPVEVLKLLMLNGVKITMMNLILKVETRASPIGPGTGKCASVTASLVT